MNVDDIIIVDCCGCSCGGGCGGRCGGCGSCGGGGCGSFVVMFFCGNTQKRESSRQMPRKAVEFIIDSPRY
jgi:hypothetical protein